MHYLALRYLSMRYFLTSPRMRVRISVLRRLQVNAGVKVTFSRLTGKAPILVGVVSRNILSTMMSKSVVRVLGKKVCRVFKQFTGPLSAGFHGIVRYVFFHCFTVVKGILL